MSRDSALDQELEHLRALNSSVDLLLETTGKINGDLATSKTATDGTSALLDDWIRIINQTKYAHSIVRNPQWKGHFEDDSDDIENIERDRASLEAELDSVTTENISLERNLQAVPSPKRTPKRVRR